MRVLITGNDGYVGAIMVPMMQAQGFDVTGIDSCLFEDCIFGDNLLSSVKSNIPYLRKDIRDIQLSDLVGIDAVVHLCGLSNDPLANINPELTYEINHKGSVRLAKLAKDAGAKRFIFSSSCSVYGISDTEIFNEKSKTNPITPYAKSKILAEKDISKLANSTFCPTFLRMSTAYGFSPKLRFDLVVNNFVAWAFTKGTVLLKSDGSAWRPFVHVEDFSQAFIETLKTPRDLVHNQIINVGKNEENYRIKEIAEIVKKIVPNSQINYVKGAEPDKRSYQVNFNKISNIFPNFKLKWNVKLGATQLLEAYKKVGLIVDEFEGSRYRRITHLENSIRSGRVDNTLRLVAN